MLSMEIWDLMIEDLAEILEKELEAEQNSDIDVLNDSKYITGFAMAIQILREQKHGDRFKKVTIKLEKK